MPMNFSSPLMIGFMVLFMVVFMVLFMFLVHVLRTNHQRIHGTASTHARFDIVSLANVILKLLLRLGIRVTILGPMMLLTTRGRKTGKPRTVPVDLYEHEGRRFLIATHGEGNWVRNLRAAGTGSLSLGRQLQTFTAVELTPEAAGPVIKQILGPLLATQGIRGSALRQHFGLAADAPLSAFIASASSHPVFEIRNTR